MYLLRTTSNVLKVKVRGVIHVSPQDYQLIVTGHSLGAGVAGILAVLLKPAYPGLHCFTYSSPGCIFRSALSSIMSSVLRFLLVMMVLLAIVGSMTIMWCCLCFHKLATITG